MTLGQIKMFQEGKYSDVYICVAEEKIRSKSKKMEDLRFPQKCYFAEGDSVPDNSTILKAYLLDEKEFNSMFDAHASFNLIYGIENAKVLCVFLER